MMRRGLILILAAALGAGAGWGGRHATRAADPAAAAHRIATAPAADPQAAATDQPAFAAARAPMGGLRPVTRSRPSPDAHVYPDTPDAFMANLDLIAAEAREGSALAALTMWTYLSRCTSENRTTPERIMQSYEQDQRMTIPGEAERRRDRALQELAMCEQLGDRGVDALGWLEYAVAMDPVAAAQTAMFAHGTFEDAERVRHAERLAALVEAGTRGLETRIAAGDGRALMLMANSFRNGANAYDPVRTAAYQYANFLIPVPENQWKPDVEEITRRLSPAQRQEALRLGQDIFDRCCA